MPFADFKETQTPEDQWDVGPGEQANSAEALAKGAKRGQVPLRPSAPEQELGRSLPHLPDRHATRYVAQVHFFPAISNVAYLKDGFVKHSCAKLP